MITYIPDAGYAPASFGIFYANLDDPNEGRHGTYHQSVPTAGRAGCATGFVDAVDEGEYPRKAFLINLI
jgi:hypothetical protein